MIALLLAAATHFPGGSTNDLAHLLRESTGQDAYVARVSSGTLKDVDFDPTSADAMNSAFRSKLDLHIIAGTQSVFTDQMIPAKLYSGLQKSARGARQQPATVYYGNPSGASENAPTGRKALPETAIKDGSITFKTEGKEALDMSSLLSAPLGKTLTMSWVYADMTPSMDVRDSTIPMFLDRLSKAVGAKFREADKTYTIDFQPDEFRRRAVHTLNAIKPDNTPEGAVYGAKIRLAVGALQALSSQDLTTVFESPGGRITIMITNNNGLVSPANGYLLALEKNGTALQDDELAVQGQQVASAGGRQRPPRNQGQQVAGIMNRIDPSRPATLTFDATFGVQLEVPILDRQGRSAGTVRF